MLIDVGLPGTAGIIRKAAGERFGEGVTPKAIVLTHGHVGHVGALAELAETWETPSYAHRLEHPYLSGRPAYPPPAPSVGGDLVARMSGLYPKRSIDVSCWLEPSALPNIMNYLADVQNGTDDYKHWSVGTPIPLRSAQTS